MDEHNRTLYNIEGEDDDAALLGAKLAALLTSKFIVIGVNLCAFMACKWGWQMLAQYLRKRRVDRHLAILEEFRETALMFNGDIEACMRKMAETNLAAREIQCLKRQSPSVELTVEAKRSLRKVLRPFVYSCSSLERSSTEEFTRRPKEFGDFLHHEDKLPRILYSVDGMAGYPIGVVHLFALVLVIQEQSQKRHRVNMTPERASRLVRLAAYNVGLDSEKEPPEALSNYVLDCLQG
jgi:hypothetical protein